MAKKFYAVKNGKTPGIFETWDECKKSVDGYSGAALKLKMKLLLFQALKVLPIQKSLLTLMAALPLILPAPPPMLTEATILPPRNSATAS